MNTIETLNTVIETLKDGEKGFREAGEDVKRLDLKSLFSTFSEQRATFAEDLQRLARAYGEAEPPNTGSFAGALHRGWINLKSAIVSRNATAILTECERGEETAVAVYRNALAEPELAEDVRKTLEEQFAEVRATQRQVHELREATVE